MFTRSKTLVVEQGEGDFHAHVPGSYVVNNDDNLSVQSMSIVDDDSASGCRKDEGDAERRPSGNYFSNNAPSQAHFYPQAYNPFMPPPFNPMSYMQTQYNPFLPGYHPHPPPNQYQPPNMYSQPNHYSQIPQHPQSNPANTRAPRAQPHRYMKPESYTGEVTLDYYLSKFEEIADWNDWSDRDRAQQLRFSLSEKLDKALKTVPDARKYDYSAVKDALRQYMGEDIKRDSDGVEEFWKRCRYGNEKLQEFAAEIRILGEKAFLKNSNSPILDSATIRKPF